MKYKLLRFSLLSMLVMLFGGWSQSASAADKWVKTSPSSLKSNDKVVIVDLTSSLAMSNNNGTSSAPVGVAVTLNDNKTEITSTVDNGITWFVEKDATTDGFKFAANLPASVGADPSTKYLYCTNSNNGVRVGTNTNNLFIFEEPYLKNVATSRYVGVFTTNPDWRCYLSKTEKNIKETVTAFFVLTKGEDDTRLATTIELANAPAEGIKGSSVSAPTATIRDASGAPVTQGGISWSSSNENVAYVSDATLYFVGAGTATITASFEGNTNYQPSSESFSVTVTAEPYTSFRALQADVSSTSVPISFTFSGQQVVFVNGKNAFLADGQGFGALVFTDGHGLVAGEKLTGTTSCNLELYQGNTEITNFDKSKLTTTTADVVPVETTLGNLSFANQSTLVTLKGLTYSDADKKLSDGTNNIIYYDKFKTNASLEDGKKYDVTGIVWIDGRASNPAPIIEICPRTAADVAEASEESSAPAEDREIIKWSERDVASAGQTAKSFSSPNQKITLEITDTDGKLAVEGNNCWFGDEEAQEKFTHRLKTGGKSSSKNALSMTVAEAGTLKIYVRTGSNSATDRNLVLTQDGVELFNQVIQESDAIKVKGMDSSDPDKETNVYPIISVPVAAGTVAITYPTNSLNFYAFEFVAGGEDTPEIPENAIWTSDEPTAIDWSGAINIAAEKFANAKIGDRIVVEIVNPNDGGQVLPKSNWKDIEGSVPVNSSTTEVAFIITGDMMKFIKAGGLMIAGQNCSTKLVTLETTETTGSDESIWLGQANGSGNFPINFIHFVNANDGEGVKAGDILHITATEATGDKWLELFNSDWSSKLTADGFDITITEDFVDKLKVQYSSAYINFGGYNITQVELIAGSEEEPHLYVIGDMNGWDRVNMIELGYNNDADAFEYSITVDKTFYLAFSENQMTQKEAENDRDWSNFNASYRLAPQEGNFTPTLDEQVQLIHVDGSIVLNPGSYTFTITKDLKMTVTGAVSPVVNADYVVAGAPASVFGEEWNSISLDNRMTLQDDGTFAITYKAVQPQDNIQFKVVMWAEDADEAVWIGDDNGNNVTFNVTSECDVTITYDPATGKITVTGDGVAFATEFEYESVYVAGNGNGSWLNGENWTPNAEANKMTKVADDVWECTVDLSNIALDTNLEFKFAIDGNWTHDFGGSFIGFGQKTAAVYGGSNIVIPFKDIKNSTYKLRLDLSDFDLATKEGAKFTVSIVEDIVPVANLGTAYNMLELGEEPIFVDIALKNARVTMVQQVTYGEFLEKLEAVGLRYFDENGAKQGLYKAPKKDVEQDTPMDFAIIEDETGAMPFLACFLEDNGVSEGSVLNGDIVVILSNDFFPLALGDELEEHITDKMTATSLQALEVTDGTAGPTEITADNAEEYKANYGFRFVKFSESELTVGSSEEQRASTLKLDVIDETVDIGDFLGTGAILDEDGTVSVEGFMYEMFGAKLFQPTKMESGSTGINSVRFFENTKGTVYNLNGQRVTTPQKGVMIVNGKKVVVK